MGVKSIGEIKGISTEKGEVQMGEMTVQQIKGKRNVYLALSTFTLLFLGLIYAFSMYAAPMCVTFGLEKAQIGLTFNIMMIAFCLGAIGGAFVEKRVGVKLSIIIGAILFAAGFIGTALFASAGIMVVYVFYGVCAGAGVGIGYNSIIATTNVWFPDKVGFSSGVLMMGFGLASLIMGTLSVSIYNGGVPLPVVFIGVGVVGGVITVVCGLFLRRPPADIVRLMRPERAAGSSYDPADEDFPLKTPLFYIYWVWAIIVIAIGLATIGNCASDAQLVGWDVGFATLLVGLVSTCNGLARVVIGMIYDKTNVKITMLVDAVIALVAVISIVGAFTLNIPILYVIGAFCCGFCYGGVPVVASAFARQRFGAKNYPINLSIINFGIVFGSLLNIIIQAAVGGDARLAVFTVLVVFAVIAVLDVIPFSKMFDKSQKDLDARKAAYEAQQA